MARSRLAAFTLLLTLGAACGGSSAGEDKTADTTVPASSDSTVPPDGAAKEGGTSKDGGSAPQSGPTSSTTAPPNSGYQGLPTPSEDQPPMPAEAKLVAPCVKAGETQTITIKAPAESGASYNTWYPDGKSGIDDGFYGGNKGMHMKGMTEWTDTWVIAPSAPPGKVRVTVQIVHVDYRTWLSELFFDLVRPTESCPA